MMSTGSGLTAGETSAARSTLDRLLARLTLRCRKGFHRKGGFPATPMGALELRLADLNERLSAAAVEAETLARLLRRREAILETAEEVHDRLDGATALLQGVEAEIRSSSALFRYNLHRRRLEGFLEPSRRAAFVAAAMYLVLEHELGALDEELADLDLRVRTLKGSEIKHRMLLEWRDDLLTNFGPGRLTAAEAALERVSCAVDTAAREEDLRLVGEALAVAGHAREDLEQANEMLAKCGKLEKDDLAALADLVPEGTRHFALREAKRRVEQATLRLGFLDDELRAVEGLRVEIRHPYFAMESFLQGLFDDLHGPGTPADSQAAVEEAERYLALVEAALGKAADSAGAKVEAARAREAEVVGRAVERLRPSPIRLTSRYSAFDAALVRR